MRLRVDATRPLAEESASGHNRWDPELEPVAAVSPGEELTLETRDGLDGQLGPQSTHADVLNLDFGLGHPLTGPVFVEGAEPGDVLEVEFVSYSTANVGVTPLVPGVGLLAPFFPRPYLVTWTIRGGFARSADLPGVAVPEATFAGVAGVAPSGATVREVIQRERAARRRGAVVPDEDPKSAIPPSSRGGLRTIPPRENGGNLDVRQLVAGSRLFLSVSVGGALFSVGDLHYAQGDGEVCGTAIEVAGAVTVRFHLHKDVAVRARFPTYLSAGGRARNYFATTGIPLGSDGTIDAMNVTLAAQNAVLEMVEHLSAMCGFTREAAYALCGATVDLQLSQVVNLPNPLVSALLPLDVFEEPPPGLRSDAHR